MVPASDRRRPAARYVDDETFNFVTWVGLEISDNALTWRPNPADFNTDNVRV